MERKKLNILFISAWFPEKNNPTLGNFVLKHIQAVGIYCNVYAVHVVFNKNKSNSFSDYEYSYENEIQILRIYLNKPNPFWLNSLFFIRFFRYINAYLKGIKYFKSKSVKFDILHANIMYPTILTAFFLHKILKTPFVITEHWTAYLPDDPNHFNFFKKFIINFFARKSSAIIPVSEDLKLAMQRIGIKGSYKVVPNVVDNCFYSDSVVDNTNNIFKFIHISSLDDAQKNISGILDTAKKLSEYRNDFEIKIITDGNAQKFIEKCKQLNIYNRFVFFEFNKSTEDVAKLLKQSDCLLMFSNYESFSVVIAESLACGIPVIATKAGGLANELDENYGIFIEKSNEKYLYEAMINMMNNYHHYDKNTLISFAQKFTPQNVGNEIFNVYKSILK